MQLRGSRHPQAVTGQPALFVVSEEQPGSCSPGGRDGEAGRRKALLPAVTGVAFLLPCLCS